MSKRGLDGILGQGDLNDPSYFDCGDSDFKTSISTLGGNEQDKTLIPVFVINGKLVRHPTDPKWSNPDLTSRDQLIAYVTGCWASGNAAIVKTLRETYKLNINKDILVMPDVQNHMRLCAGLPGFWLGYAWLNISILYAANYDKEHELNQLLAMCIVAGPKYVKKLNKEFPTWRENLTEYWSGWRDNKEIGEALIARAEQELSK